MTRHNLIALAAALAILPGAASAADPEAGRATAEEWCTNCHDIGPDGAFKQYAPSFKAISIYRSDEQIRARVLFPPVHAAMPQMGLMLEPDTIDNLVAYITSLDE